ncbi:MAG: histidine phosphatase family protein [Gammaproteobacteria bacterium]|nr:histidine phosphatase family protein [Gammaproteobacteria bacterium]
MMQRQLIIVRHAKAESVGPNDQQRVLNILGMEEAEALGGWCLAQGLHPDAVYCSSAIRTRQTWETLCRITTWDTVVVHYDAKLYLAEISYLLRWLTTLAPNQYQVMLIGHNPGLEQLANQLSSLSLPRNSHGELLATANLMQFEFPGDWHKVLTQGTLLRVFRPQNY